jgi:ABC-type dipeptide/oligopeptide/nickel transport system permease subunit
MICHADQYIYFVGFVCVFCGLVVGSVCGLLAGIKLAGWAIKNRRAGIANLKKMESE